MKDLAELYVLLRTGLKAVAPAQLAELADNAVHKRRVAQYAHKMAAGTFTLPSDPSVEVQFGAACAIHDTLADLEFRPLVSTERALRVYHERLERSGNLRASAGGAALVTSRLVATRPHDAPPALGAILPRLLPLSAEDWAELAWVPADALDDVDLGRHGVVDLAVAGLAMLATADDVKLERVELSDRAYYTGRPDPSTVRRRVSDALAALDTSGAHIGVLPELACDDDVLIDWVTACAAAPPPGALTFIVVGTGPVHAAPATSRVASNLPLPGHADIAPNRAVLLSRATGQVLLAQDKRRGFDMDDDYLAANGLDTLRPGPVNELLPASPALAVFDSRAGRFAILICEDLGRVADVGALAVRAGVTHAFVPIFAPPMVNYRWQQTAADALLREGMTVVVSNGLAMGREDREDAGGRWVGTGKPAKTLLVAHPPLLPGGSAKSEFLPDAGALPASPEEQAVMAWKIQLS